MSDYEQAVIELEGQSFGVGPEHRSAEPIHIITAYNPNGVVRSEHDNQVANADLLRLLFQRLRKSPGMVVTICGAGTSDRTHWERSYAIRGMSLQDALWTGRYFGQDAIFVIDERGTRVECCAEDAGRQQR